MTDPSDELRAFRVSPGDAGDRLDRFLARVAGLSRARVQQLMAQGHVLVAGHPVRPSRLVRVGEAVMVRIPPPVSPTLEPEPIPLDVLYEDEALVVLNKPAGIPVHPGTGRPRGTLVNALLHRYPDLPGIGGVERPGIVHRLDQDTSGVLVVARTEAAHQALSRQFQGRRVRKRYLALAHGRVARDAGRVDLPIGRHETDRKRMGVRTRRGREARTAYRVLRRWPDRTLLEVSLETGRTHQIRVHLSAIGHPVVGDRVYGGRRERRTEGREPRGRRRAPRPRAGLGAPGMSEGAPGRAPRAARQMLHAWQLGFHHPVTGAWLEFTAPIPEDFARLAGPVPDP